MKCLLEKNLKIKEITKYRNISLKILYMEIYKY